MTSCAYEYRTKICMAKVMSNSDVHAVMFNVGEFDGA